MVRFRFCLGSYIWRLFLPPRDEVVAAAPAVAAVIEFRLAIVVEEEFAEEFAEEFPLLAAPPLPLPLPLPPLEMTGGMCIVWWWGLLPPVPPPPPPPPPLELSTCIREEEVMCEEILMWKRSY